MSRYISWSPGFSFVGQRQVETPLGGGEYNVKKRGIMCNFIQGGLTPWELDAADKAFQHRGVAGDEDPRRRYSWYDPEVARHLSEWTDEEYEIVTKRLDEVCGRGDVIKVDKPRVKAPWPAYDKLKAKPGQKVADAIATKVVEDGYDPELVILYERENRNRADVIAALEAIPAEETEEVVAA